MTHPTVATGEICNSWTLHTT